MLVSTPSTAPVQPWTHQPMGIFHSGMAPSPAATHSQSCFPVLSPSWHGNAKAVATGVRALAAVVTTGALLKGTRRSTRRIAYVRAANAPATVASKTEPADLVKEALKAKEMEYRQRQAASRSSSAPADIPQLGSLAKTPFVGGDGLLQVPAADRGVRASVYAIFSKGDGKLQYVGVSRAAQKSLRAHFARRPELCGDFVIHDIRKPDRSLLEATRQAWFTESGVPLGNDAGKEQGLWEAPVDVRRSFMNADERDALNKTMPLDVDKALREFVMRAEVQQTAAFEAVGCLEQLLFDAKLKTKGFLDLDGNAPIGLTRPTGGVCTTYAVMLRDPHGKEMRFECAPDQTILDAADEAGFELPSSCKSGACSACAGKLVDGVIDQSDQQYLDDEQVGAGYCLTCVCYPRSDVNILTEQAQQVT